MGEVWLWGEAQSSKKGKYMCWYGINDWGGANLPVSLRRSGNMGRLLGSSAEVRRRREAARHHERSNRDSVEGEPIEVLCRAKRTGYSPHSPLATSALRHRSGHEDAALPHRALTDGQSAPHPQSLHYYCWSLASRDAANRLATVAA